jgi:hypothetical protein
MQPTVQSEQDKMVPIDTSGDPVEIELKQEEKEQGDSNIQVEEQTPVVEETQVSEQSEEDKDKKLEDYSDNVKRRIDKLTRKMREAERREQAAIEYAKQVKGKMDSLQTSNQNQSELYLTEREKSLTNQKEFAKRAFEAAVNAQDVEKQVAAQQEIARLTIEEERLKVSKQKNEAKKLEVQKVEEGGSVEQQIDQQQSQQAPIDPKAEAWKEKNDWFGTNRAMTYMAYDIHENLIQEGFDPTSDEYYNEVDSRIRKEFPQQFSIGGDVNKPKQRVASAVRTSPSGRRTVKLTPSQVAIAKKLGVPLEEYAKHVKEGA